MTAVSTVSPTHRTGAHRGRDTSWLRVCAALFAVAWGGNEFTPLLVLYQRDAGLSAQTTNLLLGAYVLGIAPALLVGGPLSDRFGRRPLMAPAPGLGIAGSALLALGSSSAAALFAGRVFSGLALGLVMAVGTSWVKEISDRDPSAPRTAGARRASLALTAGFGLGATVAASLAQFGPMPGILPYAVNIAITLVAWVLMARAVETRAALPGRASLLAALRVPSAGHRRFLLVVVPMAPWVFGTAASAYAILPTLLAPRVPGTEVGFSGLLCFVALSCGIASQQLAKRIDTPHSSRAVGVALAVTALGMLVAADAASTLRIATAVAAAAILGCAYGLLLVSGLQEVQRIAGPDDLAGLTAVFYALTYLGFFVPAILSALSDWSTFPVMFLAGCVAALGCLVVVGWCWRRHLPQPGREAATAHTSD